MGANLGYMKELIWKVNYSETFYDNISEVPIVTIDRKETTLPKTLLTYVITFPNNVEKAGKQISESLDKIKDWEEKRLSVAEKANGNIHRFLFIPTDDFSPFPQTNFETIRTQLFELIPKEIQNNVIITTKLSIKEPTTPLLKFIHSKRNNNFRKSTNAFVFENIVGKDGRTGDDILVSSLNDF